MSTILKALKKVEENKSEEKEGSVNIARDILRAESKEKRAENWLLPTAIAAFVLTAGMVGYFLFGAFEPARDAQAVAPEAVVVNESATATSVVDRPEALFAGTAPETGASLSSQETNAAAQPSDAGSEAALAQKETAAALKDTAQVLKDTAEALKDKVVFPKEVMVVAADGGTQAKAETVVAVRESPKAAAPPKQAAKPAAKTPAQPTASTAPSGSSTPSVASTSSTATLVASAGASTTQAAGGQVYRPTSASTPQPASPAPSAQTQRASGDFPALRVSEIHYQWEVKDRLAVVNGLPVMEGTMIEGAKVDRILKDRVRFLHNGQYREVRLQK